MTDENTTERKEGEQKSLPYEEDGYTFVLREAMTDEIIEKTAILVNQQVTDHWNEGLIRQFMEGKLATVFALKDELPEKVEGAYYNCSFSDEASEKIKEFEKGAGQYKGRRFNWGVICQGEEELVAFSDIDFYACKYWDWCEEEVYLQYRENKIIIIDNVGELDEAVQLLRRLRTEHGRKFRFEEHQSSQ